MSHKITNGLAARLALCVALSCVPMFAQGPLVTLAQGVTTEAVSAVRYGAILAVIAMATWMYQSHNHGIAGRLIMAIIGLFVALNPQPVANWIQSL